MQKWFNFLSNVPSCTAARHATASHAISSVMHAMHGRDRFSRSICWLYLSKRDSTASHGSKVEPGLRYHKRQTGLVSLRYGPNSCRCGPLLTGFRPRELGFRPRAPVTSYKTQGLHTDSSTPMAAAVLVRRISSSFFFSISYMLLCGYAPFSCCRRSVIVLMWWSFPQIIDYDYTVRFFESLLSGRGS
jgi:hypothetical protein